MREDGLEGGGQSAAAAAAAAEGSRMARAEG